MSQQSFFGEDERRHSYAEGRRLRDEGIERVLSRHKEWALKARSLALHIALLTGEVAADDLRGRIPEPSHPNAWGAVFTGEGLFRPAAHRRSTTESAHARTIKVWALTPYGRRMAEEQERQIERLST